MPTILDDVHVWYYHINLYAEANYAYNDTLAKLTRSSQIIENISLQEDQHIEVSIVVRHKALRQRGECFEIDDRIGTLPPAPSD